MVDKRRYRTPDDQDPALVRQRPGPDGAEPSGTSIHTLNLLRLATITGGHHHRVTALAAMRSVSGVLARHGAALSDMLPAVDWSLDAPGEIVIIDAGDAAPLVDAVRRSAPRNAVLVVVTEAEREALAVLAPIVAGKVARDGRATATVCRAGACGLPTTDPAVLAEQLAHVNAPALRQGDRQHGAQPSSTYPLGAAPVPSATPLSP